MILMLGCDFLGSSLGRIVHHGHGAVVDMGNDLIPEGEERILVGFLIFMDMDRRDFKRTVPLCADFIAGYTFIVFLDMNHQHV
jgi:hypothetical protein